MATCDADCVVMPQQVMFPSWSLAAQATAEALLQDQVPSSWDSLWEGPSSPHDYLRSAVKKAASLQNWLSRAAAPGGLLSQVSMDHIRTLPHGQSIADGHVT